MDLEEQFKKETSLSSTIPNYINSDGYYSQEYVEWLEQKLTLQGVVASLPSRLEMNNQSEKEFEEMKLITNKVMYKHFRLGFSTCYEWMLYVLNNKG